MEKLLAIFNLFRKGSEVGNPEAWKHGQITVSIMAAFVLALVNLSKSFGYDLPVDAATANTIGAGLLAGVNVVLTVTTSKKIGLSASTRTNTNKDEDQ